MHTLTDLIVDAIATVRASAHELDVVHRRAIANGGTAEERAALSAEIRRRLAMAADLERAATPLALRVLTMPTVGVGSPA